MHTAFPPPESYISAEVVCEYFFAFQTGFLAVVADILVGLPVGGLVSTELLIFHLLIRVWTPLVAIQTH